MRTLRRQIRLARCKKIRVNLHQHFRRRICERDRKVEKLIHSLWRVVVPTRAVMSSKSGINPFYEYRRRTWEKCCLENIIMQKDFHHNTETVYALYKSRCCRQLQQQITAQNNIMNQSLMKLQLSSKKESHCVLMRQYFGNLQKRREDKTLIYTYGQSLKKSCKNKCQVIHWTKKIIMNDS
ncbi:hypothetical protein [Candidatus Pantoea carbekii]|uniref:hypothetical protein n=1 Tax=Candidatus Pantoea carbekii TaxID=1235990 RepID=UPI0006187A0E|nr:hypothetical protein [Candidatus Pantoea carbekii]AKC32120.1 NAD-dependent deacetylase protein NpdA [Candidatus Pantoea carbekii]